MQSHVLKEVNVVKLNILLETFVAFVLWIMFGATLTREHNKELMNKIKNKMSLLGV